MEPGISWIRLVVGKVTRSKIIQLSVFAKWCVTIGRYQGRKGLVLALKTCNVLLVQALPGGKLRFDSRKIGKVAVSRSRTNLPRVIPVFARKMILDGDIVTIQLWLSFFGIYRVIPCKGRPKFSTILEPGRPLSQSFLSDWTSWLRRAFLPMVANHVGEPMVDLPLETLPRPEPFVISSVSADRSEDPRVTSMVNGLKLAKRPVPALLSGTPTSFAHRFSAAMRWTQTCLTHQERFNPTSDEGFTGLKTNILLDYLRVIPGGYGTTKSLWTLLLNTADFYQHARALVRGKPNLQRVPATHSCHGLLEGVGVAPNAHGYGKNVCGRLALLTEAAGKIRVVALMDIWSQWALRPLHDWIFGVLKEIPQDGTFDQLRPVKTLLKKVQKGSTIYSYDLSAATDRIPVVIQEKLLAQIFGQTFATAWANLLVGRPYVIPKNVARECGVPRFLRYAVGQPMGAYSSWGMLALIHHAMVQYSAHRAGFETWFTLYAVLGDDVVIADDRVARKYRALCRLLGVTIGLEKSLVATGHTLEFAKRLYFRNTDVSGLPAKFWAAAQGQSSVACALSAWVTRGTLSNFVRAMGAGFKVASGASTTVWAAMPARARALCVSLTNPLIGARFAFESWPEWLWSRSADTSKSENLEMLTRIAPFCTSVQSVLGDPAIEFLENFQEDLFFTDKIEDPVTRLTDARANKAILEAEGSINKGLEALKHLQRLNIRLQLRQVSAVVSQVWKLVDKAGLVPLPSTRATVRTEVDPMDLKVTSVYKHWVNLRLLAKPGDLVERAPVDFIHPKSRVVENQTDDDDSNDPDCSHLF
jgi:hypothetical protein